LAADDLVKRNREEILRVCAEHGALNVRIFGSFARGEAGPDSDVDLLIDVASEHSAWFPGGLLMDLQDLLGRKVDIVTEDALHWYIREQILSDAVPL
jgi:predicted nucleotidyltransferase